MYSAEGAPMPQVRAAVVSTPRSGNTWVRLMLEQAYAVPSLSRHEMADADWAKLPDEFILQIHWMPDADFLAKLAEHRITVITVARHPLDVLLSILHVAVFDVESERWLKGQAGDETALFGAGPRSRAFAEYAASDRAKALLGVSAAWWNRPGAVRVKYEDMVADPAAGLRALEPVLGPVRANLDDVLAKTSLGELRKGSTNNHFWKGRPGLWRDLLPPAEATEIAWHTKPVLDALGYSFDPDPTLTGEKADRTWLALTGPELGKTLRKNTDGHRKQLTDAYASAKAALEERAAALSARDDADRRRTAAETERAAAAAERDTAFADREQARTERDAHAAARDLAAARADDLHREKAEALDREAALAATLAAERAAAQEKVAEFEYTAAVTAECMATVRAELKAEEFKSESLAADLLEVRGQLAELRTAFDRQTGALHEARQHFAAAADTAAKDLEAARNETAAAWRREAVARAELTDALGWNRDLLVERDTARRDLAKLQAVAGNIARELDKFRGLQGFSVRTAWRVQRLRDNLPKVFGFFKAVSRR